MLNSKIKANDISWFIFIQLLSIPVTFKHTVTTQVFYIPKTLLVCFYKADNELVLYNVSIDDSMTDSFH